MTYWLNWTKCSYVFYSHVWLDINALLSDVTKMSSVNFGHSKNINSPCLTENFFRASASSMAGVLIVAITELSMWIDSNFTLTNSVWWTNTFFYVFFKNDLTFTAPSDMRLFSSSTKSWDRSLECVNIPTFVITLVASSLSWFIFEYGNGTLEHERIEIHCDVERNSFTRIQYLIPSKVIHWATY